MNEDSGNKNNEIDLAQVSTSIKNNIYNLLQLIPLTIKYIKKNIIVLIILIVSGSALGLFLNQFYKSYQSNIIVTPNFDTVDFLYEKVNLLNSKIGQYDTVYLTKSHIDKNAQIYKVEVKPITDLYRFLNKEEKYYDIFKALTENNDANKVVNDYATSKNFTSHLVTISSKEKIDEKDIKDVINFINTSEYYQKIRAEIKENLERKIVVNDSTIKQINLILDNSNSSKNSSTVFYKDDTQLSDLIEQKIKLFEENQSLKVHSHSLDYIVAPLNYSINLEQYDRIKNNLQYIIPIIFVGLFVLFGLVRRIK